MSEIEALSASLAGESEQRTLSLLRDVVISTQPGADEAVRMNLRIIYSHRLEFMGEDEVFRSRTLMEHLDPGVREEAWMSRRTAARELAPHMRDLVHARNEWAARNHNQLFLPLVRKHRGYDPETLRTLREQVSRALAREWTEEEIRDPWDPEGDDPALAARMSRHLDADGSLERTWRFFDLVGLPRKPPGLILVRPITSGEGEVRASNDRPSLPRRLFWPYATYAIDPPRQVHMLLTPEAGIFAHWSMLHEFGHAAQALLAPARGPRLQRRVGSPAVSEGVAKVAERLAYAPEWLRRNGVPEPDIAGMAEWERRSERARMRGILADSLFEEELYDDPQGNLDTIYARVQKDVAGVRIPYDIPAWATDRSLAFDPLERLDYMLARCAQAAIYRRLRSLPGGLLGDESGRVIRRDVLESAAGARYEEWFRRAAGIEPDCLAWIEDVAGLRPAS